LAVSDSALVLVVDGDLVEREVVCMVLEDAGYRTIVARNGREALDTLRNMKERPDAILLDVEMSVVGGPAFLAERRRDPSLAAVPVVLMSGANERPNFAPEMQVLVKTDGIVEVLSMLSRAIGTTP
jgi:CheY-like chemotaxis protein